jgi:hypothetical protein
MTETAEITKAYRQARGLSLRAFPDEINKHLINTDVSFSKVARWEDGLYEPPLNLLFECIATYPQTWIAQWAVDNIKIMYPDLIYNRIILFNLPKADK